MKKLLLDMQCIADKQIITPNLFIAYQLTAFQYCTSLTPKGRCQAHFPIHRPVVHCPYRCW